MVEAVSGGITTSIILFVVSLALCALFSFLETTITAIRLYKLQEIAQTTSSYAELFASLEKGQNTVLTTILIANNFANVLAATAGTWLSTSLFAKLPESIGVPLGIILTTFSLLLFGEVVPKNIAKAHGDRFFKSTLWITNILCYLLQPVVRFFTAISNAVIRRIGVGSKEEVLTSEKEIKFLIDYINKKGLLEKEKTLMLKSIFDLSTTPVKEIMIPSTSVVSLDIATTVEDALALFRKHQFSRLPVYEDSTDNIVGMLHLKDLLTVAHKTVVIKEIVRPILFVPDSLKVSQLLREFKEQHMHIAMVLNEHGGIVGLVTLEDVLEEIVGEIKDEYEPTTEKIVQLKNGTWLTDASVELEKLEEVLGIKFETEGAITLSGFLTEQLQHVPRKGNRLSYKHFQFQVQQASTKRALQVLVLREQ